VRSQIRKNADQSENEKSRVKGLLEHNFYRFMKVSAASRMINSTGIHPARRLGADAFVLCFFARFSDGESVVSADVD